jgi:gelsolin
MVKDDKKDKKDDKKEKKEKVDKKDEKKRKKDEKNAKKTQKTKNLDTAATFSTHVPDDFMKKFRAAQATPVATSSSSSSSSSSATSSASSPTAAAAAAATPATPASGKTETHGVLGHGKTNAGHPFAVAGKQAGLEVWRIEQFHVVPWPHPGQFFVGDSYVVLNTRQVGGHFSWDVHFWIGNESTQDEYGSAAISACDLDESLGGAAVQHRECQGFESELFSSYFAAKGGVVYLQGGVASGFKHAVVNTPDVAPRLLQLKGKRNVRMTQVPLRVDSLNSGDVFILDRGNDIYVWNGKSSSPQEKVKGGEVARGLRAERGGRPTIVSIQEDDKDQAKMFTHLEGEEDDVLDADEGGSDEEAERTAQKKLFKLSDSSGTLSFTTVAEGKLTMKMLDTNDVFVLDAGHEVVAWIGDKASANERKMAMHYAQEYVSKNNLPAHTPVCRVPEKGATHSSFAAYFM